MDSGVGSSLSQDHLTHTHALLGNGNGWGCVLLFIVADPDGNLVFRFQHEVRSMYHPRFMVPLRNTCGFQKSFAAPLVDALPLNKPRPTSASGSKSCCFHNHNATESVPVALVDGSVALIDLP
jgi:hypothetical protein